MFLFQGHMTAWGYSKCKHALPCLTLNYTLFTLHDFRGCRHHAVKTTQLCHQVILLRSVWCSQYVTGWQWECLHFTTSSVGIADCSTWSLHTFCIKNSQDFFSAVLLCSTDPPCHFCILWQPHVLFLKSVYCFVNNMF